MIYYSAFVILLLIIAGIIDFRELILPDFLTLPLLITGVVFNLLATPNFCSFSASLAGIFCGYGFLWFINFIYHSLTKDDGIGGGDFKLLAAIGAILGWPWVFPILFLSCLLILMVHCRTILTKYRALTTIALGPYMIVTTIMVILERNYSLAIL